MDDGSIAFWLGLGSFTVTCIASAAARALTVFSRHDLLLLAERDQREARFHDILRRHETVSWALEGVEKLAAASTLGAAAAYAWLSVDGGQSPMVRLAAVVAFTAFALLVGEVWLARSAARVWPEKIVYRLWPLWFGTATVLQPVTALGQGVDVVVHRLAGKPVTPPDEESLSEEIRSIFNDGERAGVLEEEAKEMIERIITLGEVLAGEIMKPRTEMVTMAESLDWDDMMEFVTHCGHSRIPVYRTSRDDIIGILYAKDLLPELAKRRQGGTPTPWPKLLRKPLFVPETKPVDDLLEEFQRTHNHMAIVLDEYGGVAGLVTLEDILEEIVGEIVDEFDTDEVVGIQMLNGQVAEVLGNVRVEELNRKLRVTLPEGPDFDTVAGLVMAQLGRVPEPKESLEIDNVRFTVLDATPRRVKRLRLEVLEQ